MSGSLQGVWAMYSLSQAQTYNKIIVIKNFKMFLIIVCIYTTGGKVRNAAPEDIKAKNMV